MAFALALTLSLLIGVTLGLLGGGGSILTVPILVYALGLAPKEAIATSLLVVGVTSLAALVPHLRAGRVELRTGSVFGLAGMAGAYLGGRVAHHLPAGVLLLGFAGMMLVTAVAMLRGRRPANTAEPSVPRARALPLARVLLQGLVVGAVAGLVGAGGGFLVVPALVLLGGLPMATAVGTSLLVIALQSLAGFAGYLGHVSIDGPLALLITACSVTGSLLGARFAFAQRISQERLRKTFAWFVVAMGLFMLARQLPEVLGHDPNWATFATRALPYALLLLLTPAAYALGRSRGARNAARDTDPPRSVPPPQWSMRS